MGPERDDDLLPDQTRDDTDAGWGEDAPEDDDRFRREVPPHHGD